MLQEEKRELEKSREIGALIVSEKDPINAIKSAVKGFLKVYTKKTGCYTDDLVLCDELYETFLIVNPLNSATRVSCKRVTFDGVLYDLGYMTIDKQGKLYWDNLSLYRGKINWK